MVNKAHKAGILSREANFRPAPPNTPVALEFVAVDAFYDMPEFMQSLDSLFAGEPNFSVWPHPAGDWVKW